MNQKADASCENSWFSAEGRDCDVVISTRVRLARNLASFPFPSHFHGDDAERVQALVFDSFSKFPSPDSYHAVSIENIDSSGIKVFAERGFLDNPVGTGFVMGASDNIACMVNSQDHVRIISFVPGLNCQEAFRQCQYLDANLQASLQFAASYDFGFLTSALKDCGSGMKISVRLHLPALSYSGKMPEITESLQKKSLAVSACFGTGKDSSFCIGSYYQIYTTCSCSGSELDQLVGIASAVMPVVESERKLNSEFSADVPTVIRDSVTRSYALAKFSRLITFREAIEFISNLKWGLNLGLLDGIEHSQLCALLCRIQEGHLQFVLKNSSFHFEHDVESDLKMKTDRLRALILQEAMENVRFVETA